jgi:hypothetical protein
MGQVSFERHGPVGVLWIDPPVNAIDYGIRAGLIDAIIERV